MSQGEQSTETGAVPYDDCLRFMVPSRTQPGISYLVDLESYGGHGECVCDDFKIRFKRFLAQNITPQEALARNLVQERKNRSPHEALSCQHLIDGRAQLAFNTTRSIVAARDRQFPDRHHQHP